MKCARLHGSVLLSAWTRKFNPNRSIHGIRAYLTGTSVKKLTVHDSGDFMAIGCDIDFEAFEAVDFEAFKPFDLEAFEALDFEIKAFDFNLTTKKVLPHLNVLHH
ncbi:hypothetical protein Tco_0494261 [Tanacetum coccineum]